MRLDGGSLFDDGEISTSLFVASIHSFILLRMRARNTSRNTSRIMPFSPGAP